MRRSAAALIAVACLAITVGCSSDTKSTRIVERPALESPAASSAAPSAAPVADRPLRPGEHRVTVRMPTAYTPSAPTGVGTDDYRCFLLDPKVTTDSFITGFNVRPGNPGVVHHVILFRVPPDLVAEAEAKDAETPGEGWTCFGTSGLSSGGSLEANVTGRVRANASSGGHIEIVGNPTERDINSSSGGHVSIKP